MAEVHCHIPIRIRITGIPDDDQLDRLAAAVERAVAERIALADGILRAAPAGGSLPSGPAEVQEPRDPDREVQDPPAYTVPSYQERGQPTSVPLKGAAAPANVAGTLRRVEIYLAERILLAVLDGGPPPLAFVLTEPPQVAPGQTVTWSYRDGAHRLSLGASNEVIVRFRGAVKDLDAFARLAARAQQPVPAIVYAAAGGPPAHGEKGADEGERAAPLAGDEGVMAGNAALAGLYLDFLARYAGLNVDRKQAASGLTAEQVRAITRDHQRAQIVTRYFTQGWKEFQAAGGHDLGPFSVLEETVLTQWDRGNFTALHNLLEVSKGQDGLGLYRRGTPLRYYDENGEPVPALGGGFRDSGYRAAAPLSAALQLKISDPGLLQVLSAIRHVTLDEQILIFQAAKGYADNRDLLWPAVRDGWDGWSAVNAELQRQLPVLVGFLGGHLVALVLQRSSDPRAKAIGAALEAILKISGRIFQIVFAGEVAVLAYRCGRELSLIRRQEGQPLDALSQRHLETAAVQMRQLLTMVLAAGLTAAIVKAAESTAITLGPPRGGGLTPAPAIAGAGRGPVAGAAGAFGPVPRPPIGVPVPPTQLREGDEQGGGGTRESKPETGREKEQRELRQDRPGRPPRGLKYFDYEGGDRGSFRAFVRQLRTHIDRLVPAGERDPVPDSKKADAVLNQDAEGFIKSRTALDKTWDGWSQRLARQLLSLDAEIRASRGDQARISDLTRRYREVERAKAELDDFGRGKVGDKRPDLVELFFGDQRGEVTDITQRLNDPVHVFKTLFYVEVIKAITGWSNITGVEYSSPTAQQVVTPPAPGPPKASP